MSSCRPLWGSAENDEAVEGLVELAEDDWMHIGALAFEVRRRLPDDAGLSERAAALGKLVGVLIEHGVVPGDLGVEPDLQPWPGTRQERIDRVVRETLDLNRMPGPTEIAWFYYLPDHDPRRIDRTDS
jgi:hypothetical protein